MKSTIQASLIMILIVSTGCNSRKESKRQPVSHAQELPVISRPAPAVSICEAALNGQTGQITTLLEAGTDANFKDREGRTPLMYASFNGHTEVIKKLIEKGADVNLQDIYGRSALMMASSGPYPVAVKYLLEHGADPNLIDMEERFTALMYAAAEGQIDVVKILLAHGADPGMKDIDGDAAVTFAGNNGHSEVVSLLKSVKK